MRDASAVTATPPPVLLHLGDDAHGVDRYARTVARAVADADPRVELRLFDPATLDGDATAGPDAVALLPRVHVQFTDRLWGRDPEHAAARIEALARRTRVLVTLHDLPQASDGPTRLPRRLGCYRRVVAAATAVVCNSEHERTLLDELTTDAPSTIAPTTTAVVPLPVPTAATAPERGTWRSDGSVAVLGFFYPGKGHREVVDAVAHLARAGTVDPVPPVVALGRASAGHEGELAELAALANARGVAFSSTGFLSDADLVARSRSAAVPVIAHQHVSASGSLTDWIAAGRRPLVPDSGYFREMADLRPGTTTPVPAADLPAAIAHALANPASTWQDARAVTRPDLADTARSHLALWAADAATSGPEA